MTGKKFKNITLDGLLRNNPTLRLVLGTCPTLALSTTAMNGIGMGLAVTFILICSNALISALRKVIPNAVRIPAFVLIIATFVTVVRMVMEKYIPDLYANLGVYLPLIVVNCIILGRAESFASKNPVLDSACDGLFTGLGFTWALTLLGCIREILGSGSIFGAQLWNFKIEFFTSAAGAFFTYGMMIAIFNAIYRKIESIQRRKQYNILYPTAVLEEVAPAKPVVKPATNAAAKPTTDTKPVIKPEVKAEVKPAEVKQPEAASIKPEVVKENLAEDKAEDKVEKEEK